MGEAFAAPEANHVVYTIQQEPPGQIGILEAMKVKVVIMTTPSNKTTEKHLIGDFNGDPLPDWVGLSEFLHLLLLEVGTDEELESHRGNPFPDCQLCEAGASDEAYRAFLFDDDRSLVREFMAQKG